MHSETSGLKTLRTNVHREATPMSFWTKCLGRIACVLLFAGLAGCQPRDPLDLKISAGSAEAFDRWLDRYDPRLSPDAAHEFHQALEAVYRGTLTADNRNYGPGVRFRTDAFFKKIDGRTVRQIIADGYFLTNTNLRRSIANELDNMQRNLTRAARNPDANATDGANLQELVKRQEARIEKLKTELTTNEWRVAQFTTSEAK